MNTQYTRWVLLIFTCLAVGCGTMTVRTNHPQAKIYVDGQFVGEGQAHISSMGPPKTSTIRVSHNGRSVEHHVKRSFTLVTFLTGMMTYATGFAWAWEYPENIQISLESSPGESPRDEWTSEANPWMNPLYEESNHDEFQPNKASLKTHGSPTRVPTL